MAFFWSESLQHHLSTSLSMVPTRSPWSCFHAGSCSIGFEGTLIALSARVFEGSFRLGPGHANLNISDRLIILYLFSYTVFGSILLRTSLSFFFFTYSSLLRKYFQYLDEILETVSQSLHRNQLTCFTLVQAECTSRRVTPDPPRFERDLSTPTQPTPIALLV